MTEHLLQDWLAVNHDLCGLQYAVAGGLAVGIYSPQRFTQDLDMVIISISDTEANLQNHGYTRKGDLSIGGSTWLSPAGREIDVIDISNRAWGQAAITAAQNNVHFGFPVLPPEYLVLMKLEASRMQDIADIGRVLHYADEATRRIVRATVGRYRPSDLDDLEQIIALEDLSKIP